MTQRKTCPECKGKGKVPEKNCSKCHGQGTVKEKQTLKLEIPRGVKDGQRIRFQGKGKAGREGVKNGDLYARVRIKNDTPFERKGKDLYYDLDLEFPQAALGDKVKIPTMEKDKTLKIPKGVEAGKKIRVRGEGMPSIRGGQGDLYARVHINTPEKLSKKSRELLKELKEELK
jgi:molecular chaperone DnaJ